jgi:imidazole glycerol phosphate synthase glutamine amidotransferase subunit
VATVGIIDTQAGNLTSVLAAFQRLNQPTRLLTQASTDQLTHLVIPGQGRFGPVMNYLQNSGWLPLLNAWRQANKPLLGICVGLQILFEASDEDPGIDGLGWLTGKVQKLASPKQPMMGWAEVNFSRHYQDGYAYFVNSYVLKSSSATIGVSEYGESFCAAVQQGSTTAFQFHPEKSAAYGQQVLAQWL